MGLLDFANTDEGMQGLGLLSAAAPSMAPMNLAGRLAMATQSYHGLRKDALQNKMLALQEMRAQQMFEMQKDAYYGSPDGGTGAAPAPTIGLGMPGQSSIGQTGVSSAPGQSGMPSPGGLPQQSNLAAQLDRVGRMAIAGVPGAKEQLEILKYKNDPQVYAPGSLSVNRVTGQTTSIPTVSTDGKASQIIPDASAPGGFRVIAPEGALATYSSYADAGEDSKLVDVPNGNGGTTKMFGRQARQLLSGQASQPTAPQSMMPQTQPSAPMADAPSSAQFVMGKNGVAVDPQEIMRRIAQIPDAKQRMESTQIMQALIAQNRMGQPAQASQVPSSEMPAGAIPAGSQPGYTPPAAQLAAEQARLLAGVAQGTKPQLDYSTNAAQGFQKMGESINGRLSESQALLQRISESRDALTRFKAGGGNDTRLGMAQTAQGLGMPTTIVDRIAGGDLSAVQEFQKFAAQEALQTMQQSLSTDSGPAAKGNRLSMDLFIKNNPNITTDPRAIEKIFNFQTKLHDDALAQSNAFAVYVKDPSKPKDPALFGNEWANANLESGRVKAVMQSGQALGVSTAKPTNMPMKGQVVQGFKFKGGNPADKNNWEQQ